MSRSYQHEIPSARVNITLDVETGGSSSKKELPMKLLMLGDFSHGKATKALASRERVTINKHNFNQILESFAPQASFLVSDRIRNNGELAVNLEFNDFADFKPEKIVEQIPQLQRLMAMRHLLKDLKACIIDNQAFRRALEKMMQDPEGKQQLLQELKDSAPLNLA